MLSWNQIKTSSNDECDIKIMLDKLSEDDKRVQFLKSCLRLIRCGKQLSEKQVNYLDAIKLKLNKKEKNDFFDPDLWQNETPKKFEIDY
jgi:predicted DNA-binding ribbon-helix-helix protein